MSIERTQYFTRRQRLIASDVVVNDVEVGKSCARGLVAVELYFRSVRPSRLHCSDGAGTSTFATQELAHCSGVTHQEAFNVRRLIAGFSLNLLQELRGVLVCSRREVKGQKASVKTATVHSDIIVFTAETAEHSFKLMLYCDMPAILNVDAGHSHAIPNWFFHGASILEEKGAA
jgi:hypothetical protein